MVMPSFGKEVSQDKCFNHKEDSYSPRMEMKNLDEKDSDEEPSRKRTALDYTAVWNYIEKSFYPEGLSKNQKANFRRQCKPFIIINKKLWWRKQTRTAAEDPFKDINLENLENTELFDKGFRIVVAGKNEREEKLKVIHENVPTSVEAKSLHSHHGRDKSIHLLKERYYWSGMVENMRDYCAACTVCEKENTSILKVVPQLRPVGMPPKVMYQIGVDLVTLPTVNGYTYIYVAICYFSKWVEARPAQNKDAYSVAKFLFEDIICRHGCPRIQINDQGRELVNQISDELHRFSGAKQRVTSAYHPQANGMTEKQNHTILRRLVKCLSSIEQWPEALPGVLFACRTALHAATKFKPFYLMYLRNPILPMDLNDMQESVYNPDNYLKLSDDGVDENPVDENEFNRVLKSMLSIKNKMHEMAQKNIKKAQKRYKAYYDKRHNTDVAYKVGEDVFIDNPRQKNRKGKGKALSTRSGPYKIVEIIDNSRVALKNIRSNSILKSHYSMEHIFHCRTSSTEIFDLEEDEENIFESSSVNTQDRDETHDTIMADGVYSTIPDPSEICDVIMGDGGHPVIIFSLQNGNTCPDACVSGQQVRLLNTCAFDSVMHILTEACHTSEAYSKFVREHYLDDSVMSFIHQMAEGGSSEALYEKRAEILLKHFGRSREQLRDREVVVNCNTNCTTLVERLFSLLPGTHEVKTCSGSVCLEPKPAPIPRPVLFIRMPQEGICNLQSTVQIKVDHVSTATCLSRVRQNLSVSTPGVIKHDNALRCNGKTNVICHLAASHLFIEVRDDNKERLLECAVELGEVPCKLILKGIHYHLRGLVEFQGSRKATVMGHYIGHVRADKHWYAFNDLSSKYSHSTGNEKVRCHLLVYTV